MDDLIAPRSEFARALKPGDVFVMPLLQNGGIFIVCEPIVHSGDWVTVPAMDEMGLTWNLVALDNEPVDLYPAYQETGSPS